MHSAERHCTFMATNEVYDNTFMPANDQINEMVRHQTVPLLLQLSCVPSLLPLMDAADPPHTHTKPSTPTPTHNLQQLRGPRGPCGVPGLLHRDALRRHEGAPCAHLRARKWSRCRLLVSCMWWWFLDERHTGPPHDGD